MILGVKVFNQDQQCSNLAHTDQSLLLLYLLYCHIDLIIPECNSRDQHQRQLHREFVADHREFAKNRVLEPALLKVLHDCIQRKSEEDGGGDEVVQTPDLEYRMCCKRDELYDPYKNERKEDNIIGLVSEIVAEEEAEHNEKDANHDPWWATQPADGRMNQHTRIEERDESIDDSRRGFVLEYRCVIS